MKRRIIIIILLLALAGAGVYAYRGMNRKPDNRLMVSGNIELTEVAIAFKTAGRLVERDADEGDSACRSAPIEISMICRVLFPPEPSRMKAER